MVLVRGGTIQVGIEAAQIPSLEKVFKIQMAELLQNEVPKHSVTVDDFYLDRYLVTNAEFMSFTEANPEWRPGHISPELDNGNYLRHWTTSTGLGRRANHPAMKSRQPSSEWPA